MPVTEAELWAGLADALGGPVRAVARRGFAYSSSHPIEDLDVVDSAGRALRILFKDLSAASPREGEPIDVKPAFVRDPMREIAAYRSVLGPGHVDAPAFYGSHVDARSGRAWLFLEALDGELLWQAGDLAAWEAAARWLADLHGRDLPTAQTPLLRYDEAWFRGWLKRAQANTPPGALDRIAEGYDRVVQRLAGWPTTFVHGEFYASNVLVQRDGGRIRIRPLDWEMAGQGPGLLDVGALTAGRWTGEERRRIALAYFDAGPAAVRGGGREDFLDALAHCRLHLAVQWLGWSGGWTPPAQHAHDWLADARETAQELGL
jgi:hypothetical protein